MKKTFMIFLSLFVMLSLCSCAENNGAAEDTTTAVESEKTEKSSSEKYADSEYLGKWYNIFSDSDVADFEFEANGSVLYNGEAKGKWTEEDNGITISIKIDGEKRKMTGYFIIACDGFVCRATEENQHYIDDGKGEKQLEIMLTETTCIDCVKKDA